ncbi:MAG: 50S ribosomal protein L6 [Candidatus Uhrbacteria bacterium GW2011_GWF2_41_16]|uniref:Large ribosomal subunit protein uL6 n=2 Tax=Candidatus Uhriibacteriota TaxID=1752732 RepID=A0A0G0VC38_9BACT|nr:MAG: 50S ribosomal protein L6 [Candidatus Uhrbacteria bacterium GW2011_GWA2_41_10]KKR87533.1 MAG: 50S ribosomal protein L6 [Candidatus Uhrbacteria bacterium GW2011_GWC2_41_11]KKR98513.1 MAG: 50S ribosomal protein L6 [Candidatus Uhrbacteria bacterium GW2011_GWF2_41_16]HBO99951.1 50S ribosomal protein L6 [Candidatus Uhrbacteria bacterium]
MSRVGAKPIVIPAKAEVVLEKNIVSVKGPNGSLIVQIHPFVTVSRVSEDGRDLLLLSVVHSDQKEERALWGTMRALINNALKGVTEGFSKALEVVGVGYRANIQGMKIIFDVGYSHPVEFLLPSGVTAMVEKNVVTLRGFDRQLVGETAARIRRIRKPEPYKGTGIKYVDEVIRRKAGKTGKTAG